MTLRFTHFKSKTETARLEYKKQQKLCATPLKKRKKKTIIKIATITENKTLWYSVKPLFSNKVKTKDNLKLIED